MGSQDVAKGETIRERVCGCPPAAAALIAKWNEGLVENILRLVWDAYDQLCLELLGNVDWSEDYDDLERSISQDLERVIRRNIDGFMPVSVQHGPFEHESRSRVKRNAQPPQYDIAFFWISEPRLMWPLEAKVVKSDGDTEENLKDYIDTVNTRYLTCYYAPFSSGGAMIAYLKSGDAEDLADHIAARLGCTLRKHTAFAKRCHKISGHRRTVPPGKDYPLDFCCHHLIMPLSGGSRS